MAGEGWRNYSRTLKPNDVGFIGKERLIAVAHLHKQVEAGAVAAAIECVCVSLVGCFLVVIMRAAAFAGRRAVVWNRVKSLVTTACPSQNDHDNDHHHWHKLFRRGRPGPN